MAGFWRTLVGPPPAAGYPSPADPVTEWPTVTNEPAPGGMAE